MQRDNTGTALHYKTLSLAEVLNRAEALIESSHYKEAREELQEISRNFQFPILSRDSYRFHYLRGLLLYRLGELPAAGSEFEEALRIFKALYGSHSLPKRENLPDYVKEKLRNLREMEVALLTGLQELDGDQSTEKREKLEERIVEISNALDNLGPLSKLHYYAGCVKLMCMSKLDEAREHFEYAATGSLLSKDWAVLARALNGISQVHFYKSELWTSIQILERGIAYIRKAGDRHFEAILQSQLVNCQHWLGLWRPSISSLPEILAELQNFKDITNYCSALLNWGYANLLKGNLKESERAFRKSFRIAAEHKLATFLKLSHTYSGLFCLETGKFEEAENHMNKALGIARRAERGGCTELVLLRILGDAYLGQNQFEKARKAYAACQNLLTKIPQKDEEAAMYRGLGAFHSRQGQFKVARKNFKKALDIFTVCNNQWEKAKTFVIAAESGVFTQAEMEHDIAWAKEIFKRLEHPSWVKRARALSKRRKDSRRAVPLPLAREQAEREQIIKSLLNCNGNITQAAKKLGLLRQTLQYKIRCYGIEV